MAVGLPVVCSQMVSEFYFCLYRLRLVVNRALVGVVEYKYKVAIAGSPKSKQSI